MSEDDRFKLVLDLVPRSCWFSNLRSELPTKDWDRLRGARHAEAGHRCEICGARSLHRLECHERWSYDDDAPFLVQRLDGLIALCRGCHEVKHLGLTQARGRLEPALAHFCRVNAVDRETAVGILRANFDEWAERSRREWDLDISWLDGQGIDARTIERAAQKHRREIDRDREKIGAAVLAKMETERGPTPEGSTRLAIVHSCGHATGLEVVDLSEDDPAAARYFEGLMGAAEGVCPDCLGLGTEEVPIAQAAEKPRRRRERTVEDDDGVTYDLVG